MSDVVYALLMLMLLLAALACSRRSSGRRRPVGRPSIDQSSTFVVVVPAPYDDEEGIALAGDRVSVAAQEMIRIFLSLHWKVAADPLAVSRLPSSPAALLQRGRKGGGRKEKMRGRCRGEGRGEERRWWWREFRNVLDAWPGGQMAGGNGSPDAKATPKRIPSTQKFRRVPRPGNNSRGPILAEQPLRVERLGAVEMQAYV
jgi:hypothetical protein